MRIAILEPYIEGIGGAQKVIAEYAFYLKSKGHDVEIFTQRKGKTPYPKFKQIKINLLKSKSKFFSVFNFNRKFKGFDIIISNDWPTHFASLKNNNVVWICFSPKRDFFDLREYTLKNSSFFKKIYLFSKIFLFKKIDMLSAKKCRLILPISKTVRERVKKFYNLNAPNIFYCGINFKDYQQGKYKDYVLCVSRLEKPKRVDLVIKSMGFVKNKKIKLYIFGDGQEKESLKNLAKKYSNVTILDNIKGEKLLDPYANCLAVVFVPINEDWGLIPLEAGASGKLTIGANEGGLKETIVDGKTGFLIDDVTPEKIAEKINYLAENKKIAKRMGLKARNYIKTWEWKHILPKFEKLIIKATEKNL